MGSAASSEASPSASPSAGTKGGQAVGILFFFLSLAFLVAAVATPAKLAPPLVRVVCLVLAAFAFIIGLSASGDL